MNDEKIRQLLREDRKEIGVLKPDVDFIKRIRKGFDDDELLKDTRREIRLKNGSVLTVFQSVDGTRGRRYDLFIMDKNIDISIDDEIIIAAGSKEIRYY